MDGRHLEPGDGLHEGQPGVRPLLCRGRDAEVQARGPFLPGKATIRLHDDRLDDPGRWRRPRRVFVNSMSDLFHEQVPFDFVDEVFDRMVEHDRHVYQVLTKRPERMAEYSARMDTWPANVWAGVSVENQIWADRRIPLLTAVPASVRFLSVEPLLKAVDLSRYLDGVQWVIVGGESGPRARPMAAEWARSVRDDCLAAGVPFFFKQWGGRHAKAGGRELDGETWNQMPREVRVKC